MSSLVWLLHKKKTSIFFKPVHCLQLTIVSWQFVIACNMSFTFVLRKWLSNFFWSNIFNIKLNDNVEIKGIVIVI